MYHPSLLPPKEEYKILVKADLFLLPCFPSLNAFKGLKEKEDFLFFFFFPPLCY